MAGLPAVSGVVVPELEGGGGLRGRDPGVQLKTVHSSQGRSLGMQSLLQKTAEGKKMKLNRIV